MILINLNKVKVCRGCDETKSYTEFFHDKYTKDGFKTKCKACCRILHSEWYAKNTEKARQIGREYYYQNREKMIENSRRYKEEHKEERSQWGRQYRAQHREARSLYGKRYREDNKEKIYIKTHSVEHKKNKNLKYVEKYNSDVFFKLRKRISNSIYYAIKAQNSTKKGSCLKHLPFTIKQLKEHLQDLFEPWMNWENHGNYNPECRSWQIDHIIPQVMFPYDSMEHENFKKCWALENLRPLESAENLLKRDRLLSD